MRTAWGYEVSEGLEPIITVELFNARTGGKYATNPRVEAALKAASQAVRNCCGWHVSPAMECTARPHGGSALTRLPAAYVSSIVSVKEEGEALTDADYEWREDGLIRRTDKTWTDKWNGIEVKYNAGYDADAVPDLAETVSAIAAGVLSVASGVTSESADGVTISYSASAASIAASLTSQQRSALEPYKVVGSHAA
jgi:hypothetical protein